MAPPQTYNERTMAVVYTPTWCAPLANQGDTDAVSRVLRVTGATVPLEQIASATYAIEALTGLIEAVPRTDMNGRDLYWLGQAVAYEAAWLVAQPDFLERNNVTSASQDGQTVAMGPDALTLAPMARKCLRRLSWRGMRGINLDRRLDPRDFAIDRYNRRLEQREAIIDAAFDAGSGGYGFGGNGAAALTDASDAGQPWGAL